VTINVKLGSYWDKSDFAMLSFQSHSRTSVIVPNRIVGAVEGVGKVVAEVAEIGEKLSL